MKRSLIIVSLLILSVFTASSQRSIIPRPAAFEREKGHFDLHAGTSVLIGSGDPEYRRLAAFLSAGIGQLCGFSLQTVVQDIDKKANGVIRLALTTDSAGKDAESYVIHIQDRQILLEAPSTKGLFYAIQSLLQLLPAQIQEGHSSRLPCLTIKDSPRFPYRGLHFDVCRHFFPVEFIKQYIDLMARYKYNTLHWHLTDDQGWRIEIKQYPLLTQIGSWRQGTQVGKSDVTDNQKYGGFYTQEQIMEIVKYASERYITVIPEIEMPGHAVAALTAYPRYSCTGGPFEVRTMWGVSDDVFCAGKDSTFYFLQGILEEVIDLFPSKYIHIGGDEVPKSRWSKCADCQQRMKQEGLADEHELQAYFIHRIGAFLEERGRKLIGWDEILEGGLAPGATVMSWRGTEGGIAAARQGHDVIMTPGSHCYFDHYQADPAYEPLAIGGFTPLKKVYSFEPVPDSLSLAEASHVLGAQGNLWTEYIDNPDHAFYMAYPRALALSEVNWSPGNSRNWDDFIDRLDHHFYLLDRAGIPYCKSLYDVTISTVPGGGTAALLLVLSTDWKGMDIRYTLDGSEPGLQSPLYTAPLPLLNTTNVKACVFQGQVRKGRTIDREIRLHLAAGKNIRVIQPYSEKYPGRGDQTLADGMRGTLSFGGGAWQGYLADDADLEIDLGQLVQVNTITASFLKNIYSWIFLPLQIEVFFSQDGENYKPARKQSIEAEQLPGLDIRAITLKINGIETRYIRFKAINPRVNPPWHESAGQPCWIFMDEIIVE